LILTKPLGTGIVSTALKADAVHGSLLAKSIACMTELNKKAAELVLAAGDVHSCTDITGFGFLGHACETIENSDVGLRIFSQAIPVLKGVRDLLETGYVPGGLYRNRDFRIAQIEKALSCPDWIFDVCFDPQTAGGLFFSLPAAKAPSLVKMMHAAGITDATVVGDVTSEHPGRIFME